MVSLIIPVYRPDYEVFKKCLKSLITQSFKEWEAVIALDGPDNAARIIVDGFTDKRLKVVEKAQGGAPAARNEGFKHATGEIVWFWDCDCVIEPDTCMTLVKEFDNKDVAFVYSGYKFLGENGGIPAEPFDPWTLKCGNYISTCFPMRKEAFPGFDESLKAFQDWDLWLTIVERGGKGLFVPGYAFSTKVPDAQSISGRNFQKDTWLDRVAAVKNKHNLPDRKVCVSSQDHKAEGIRLAKLIDADYKDVPNYKPNDYDTIIQVGFSLHPGRIRTFSGIFNQALKKKIIFWTRENIQEIQNTISHKALTSYTSALNHSVVQFVEDLYAKEIMESAGFKVAILPMPLENTGDIAPLPATPKILVDITDDYRQLVACLCHSLPEIQFEHMDENKPINDYNAILSLNTERTMSFNVKRMLLCGKNVISNIQSPFCGYVDVNSEIGKYMSELVDATRKRVNKDTSAAVAYYKNQLSPNKLQEILK